MDLLRTLLLYMVMVFVTSVQTAPEPTIIPEVTATIEATATPTLVPTPSPTPVPTPAITPNTAYKTIKVGDNGEDVRAMQAKLAEYGYYTGDIDGRFGNQTRRAVEQFQYNQGISADGIAGRYTLTLLYESADVRLAPTPEPSPEASTLPTARASDTPIPIDNTTAPTSDEPAAAASAQSETDAPSDTPALSDTPAPTDTPTPTAEPTSAPTPVAEFMPVEGYAVALSTDEATPLLSKSADDPANTPLEPYAYGDSFYVPLLRILDEANVLVIPNVTIELSEYAFVINEEIYRIAFTEDQSGSPVDLAAYLNNEPQTLPVRDIRMAHGEIYLPMESVESLTGITFALDDEQKRLLVTMPAAPAAQS